LISGIGWTLVEIKINYQFKINFMKQSLKLLLKSTLVIILLGSIMPIVYGQDAPLGHLMSVTEFTVKPGHEMQFREGIKAWKACYLENKGEWT
jgi:hypothetical protein